MGSNWGAQAGFSCSSWRQILLKTKKSRKRGHLFLLRHKNGFGCLWFKMTDDKSLFIFLNEKKYIWVKFTSCNWSTWLGLNGNKEMQHHVLWGPAGVDLCSIWKQTHSAMISEHKNTAQWKKKPWKKKHGMQNGIQWKYTGDSQTLLDSLTHSRLEILSHLASSEMFLIPHRCSFIKFCGSLGSRINRTAMVCAFAHLTASSFIPDDLHTITTKVCQCQMEVFVFPKLKMVHLT